MREFVHGTRRRRNSPWSSRTVSCAADSRVYLHERERALALCVQ